MAAEEIRKEVYFIVFSLFLNVTFPPQIEQIQTNAPQEDQVIAVARFFFKAKQIN